MTPGSRAASSTPPCWPASADVPSKSPSSTASSNAAGERDRSSGGGSGNSDQIFKCTFCDTPFLSKGAYRHHLAKMHFIKEKSPTTIPSSLGSSTNPEIANNNSTSANNSNSDSPTSKFIKYTELAKQLSSK